MEGSGVKVDPVTLKPVTANPEDKALAAEELKDKNLKAQAAWMNVSQTEAGRQLVDLIREKLNARVSALVKADPEADAYVKILTDLGVKEGMATAASRELVAKALKRAEK
jgi:hypothetical protein